MKVERSMTGRVISADAQWFVVECPDAPAHLQHLNLVRGQMCGATVGDHVRLEYHTSASRGLWNVVEILEKV